MPAATEAGGASTCEDRAWALPPSCLYVTQLTTCSDASSHFKQVNLAAIQASLQMPELWLEAQMLRRLVYKNQNQHRSSHMMRHIRAVLRQLSLLQALELPCLLSDLDYMIQLASSARDSSSKQRPGSSGLSASRTLPDRSRQTHRVACQEAGAVVMGRLMAGCHISQALVRSCMEAAQHLAAQVAKTFFMPLCITALSMMSRIQALSMQLLTCNTAAYNSLALLLPLLPPAAPSGPAPPAAHTPLLSSLPQSLQCSWQGQLPHMSVHAPAQSCAGTGPAEQRQGWLQAQAAELWQELGLMQGLEVLYVGPPGLDAVPVSAAKASASPDAQLELGIPRSNRHAAAATPAHTQLDLVQAKGVVVGKEQTACTVKADEAAGNKKRSRGGGSEAQADPAPGASKVFRTGNVTNCKQPPAAPSSKAAGGLTSKKNSFFDLMATKSTGAVSTANRSAALSAAAPAPAAYIDKGRQQGKAGLPRGEVPVYATALSLGLGARVAGQPAASTTDPAAVSDVAQPAGDGSAAPSGPGQAQPQAVEMQPQTQQPDTTMAPAERADLRAHVSGAACDPPAVLPVTQVLLSSRKATSPKQQPAQVAPAFVRVGGSVARARQDQSSKAAAAAGLNGGSASQAVTKSSWEDLLLGPAPAAPAAAPGTVTAQFGGGGGKGKQHKRSSGTRPGVQTQSGDGILDLLLSK